MPTERLRDRYLILALLDILAGCAVPRRMRTGRTNISLLEQRTDAPVRPVRRYPLASLAIEQVGTPVLHQPVKGVQGLLGHIDGHPPTVTALPFLHDKDIAVNIRGFEGARL